jgi:hypothetical protein
LGRCRERIGCAGAFDTSITTCVSLVSDYRWTLTPLESRDENANARRATRGQLPRDLPPSGAQLSQLRERQFRGARIGEPMAGGPGIVASGETSRPLSANHAPGDEHRRVGGGAATTGASTAGSVALRDRAGRPPSGRVGWSWPKRPKGPPPRGDAVLA